MTRLRYAFALTSVCLLLTSRPLRAEEPAPSILNALHLEIVNEHLTASWTGASPGTTSKNFEFRAFIHNPDKHFLNVKVVEKEAPHRQLNLVSKDGDIQELTLTTLDAKEVLSLTQNENGASLAPLGNSPPFHAGSFRDLMRQNTGPVQSGLLHPLAELGVTIELSPDLPVVMALAASGYSAADPAIVAKINALLPQLTDKDEVVSSKAKADLNKLFPLAIKHLTGLAKSTTDAALKAQLESMIAAHPGIAKAREYVEKNQLQNKRDYLKSIVDGVPLLKDAAAMRLKELGN